VQTRDLLFVYKSNVIDDDYTTAQLTAFVDSV